MKEISKKDEQRIIEALEKAVKEANKGTAPDEALVKVAEEYEFQPEIIKRMVAAYNTSKTLAHLKNASDEEKGGSFPIASPEAIIGKLFPQEPATPAKEASSMLHTDYYTDDGTEFRSMDKSAKVFELPAMTEKKAEAYKHEDSYASKKALDNHRKLAGLAKQADDGFREIYFKFLGALDKTAAYWRGTGSKESFALVEKRATAQFGEPAKTIMTMIHGHGKLDDSRLNVKRASAEELDDQQMHFDPLREPYNKIAGLLFLTNEMNRIRKEAAEIRNVMDDHAVSNIHLLPPQPVYDAIERFMKSAAAACPGGKLKSKGKGRGLGIGKGKGPIGMPFGEKMEGEDEDEDEDGDEKDKKKGKEKSAMPFMKQDRAKKTKEIYSAIKKEHPEYSAGKKARIAESANNKSAHVLDDVFAKE